MSGLFVACGLALENLAKGICIARDPNVVKDDRYVGHAIHLLLDLLNHAKVTLSKEESELVERLETFVIWAGRYPIPRQLAGYLPRAQPGGGFGPLSYFSSKDPALIEGLLERLEGILEAAG